MSDFSTKKSSKTFAESKIRVKEPDLYKVVMLNDNYTTMEFVVMVLMVVFDYDKITAVEKMFSIHNSVKQIVGKYAKTIAEYKVQQCNELKKEQGFPWFRVEIERENGEDA